MNIIVFTLNTKAKSEYRNGNGEIDHNEYPVHIKLDTDYSNGFILKIEDTPGSWHMSTLMGDRYGNAYNENNQVLSIHGMKWMCVNIFDLLKEANETLEKMNMKVIPDNR